MDGMEAGKGKAMGGVLAKMAYIGLSWIGFCASMIPGQRETEGEIDHVSKVLMSDSSFLH
jgi:hypothetical protein